MTSPRDSIGNSSSGPLTVGQRLGNRYEIIRLLGIGDTGAVYQAWDSELEVAVAFKVIRPAGSENPAASAEMNRRFKRESLLARQLTHPNVVRIDDAGEIGGISYVTRPYIEGRDLGHVLADSATFPIQRALSLARQIVFGLCAAHDAGIVHRNLKPANLLIDANDRVLIVDFGTPRSAVNPGERSAQATASLEYMAPEQVRGGEVDHRADIYAFGLILRRMLERRPQQDATVREALDDIVSKCLQPDPADRYATVQQLRAALDRLDANGVRLPGPPLWRRWQFWAATATATAIAAWWLAQ